VRIVDSSVWIAYFNGDTHPQTESLIQQLEKNEDPLLFPVITLEVLAGFKNDSDFNKVRTIFNRLDVLELSPEVHIKAASLYRGLRKKGVTVRGVTDCLIAQGCIEYGASLLTLDRDFKTIAQHSSLKLIETTS
jgi:predicted nucleic acid-binding protein